MLLRKQAGRAARARAIASRSRSSPSRCPGMTTPRWSGRLRAIGARAVEVLAPGFVSATLERGRLSELDDIASVGIKPRKRPLGAAR